MTMPGRGYNAGSYRYGFNGKEDDNDITNGGQDYGMRIYDKRLGRFLSVDPITNQYPSLTPYQFASNRPIDGIDQDGLEYLRFDKVADIGNNLVTYYHNNGGLGFPVVEYKGNKYYNVGTHLTNAKGQQITQWVYSPIAPVIKKDDYVGYNDNTPHDCMVASKAQIAKQDLIIGGYNDAIQMFKNGKVGNPVNENSKSFGIDAIQKSLESGNSIIVGVDYTSSQSANIGTDNTTDHFVTIVGRGNDKGGEFFTFYENAISNKEKGTDVGTNKFYLQTDGTLKGKTSWSEKVEFKVTQVRPTNKKEE